MSKKLFSWTTSSKTSNKLVTDAVVLEEDNVNVSERTQSNVLSISPLSPEMRFQQNVNNQNIPVRRSDYLVDEPRNASSVNNLQQNIYISHVNNSTIGGWVFNIINNVEQPERRYTTGEAILKTKSIDGES